MKLRTVHIPSAVGPEQTRDQVAYVLGTLGWTGSWVDPWSGLAQQGSEGASAIAGPFAGFCQVHWAVETAPTGQTRVTIRQVRNSWVGKGGIVDGKRAGKRLDELQAALRALWAAPGAPTGSPAAPAAGPHAATATPAWAPTGPEHHADTGSTPWAPAPSSAPSPAPPPAPNPVPASASATDPGVAGAEPSPWARDRSL